MAALYLVPALEEQALEERALYLVLLWVDLIRQNHFQSHRRRLHPQIHLLLQILLRYPHFQSRILLFHLFQTLRKLRKLRKLRELMELKELRKLKELMELKELKELRGLMALLKLGWLWFR